MIDDIELSEAVRLHQKAYGLLMWLAGAMNSGFISPKSAHTNMSIKEVAEGWIVKHFLNLPNNFRPDINNKDELSSFSNLFSTFLLTSFDIIDKPGKRLYSEDAHCFCPMCSYLIDISHLKTKKLTKKDKLKAQKLKSDTLRQLCIDENLEFPKDNFESMIQGTTGEYVSIIAYGHQLILRSKGVVNGPSVLALWRECAWNNQGSSKKKFKFTEDTILKAKRMVIEFLRG